MRALIITLALLPLNALASNPGRWDAYDRSQGATSGEFSWVIPAIFLAAFIITGIKELLSK